MLETAQILRDHGLVVEDVVVFLDRQQGGRENLENNGIRVHCVTNTETLMSVLFAAGRVTVDEKKNVLDFVKGNKVQSAKPAPEKWRLKFEARSELANNPISKMILDKMAIKKSNLCVAIDVDSPKELLTIADKVGPHVFCVKTHVDILEDWTEDVAMQLRKIAKKHDFLLFEDRKLADIGKTVAGQFYGGMFKIGDWADLVTIHGIAGPGVISGLQGSNDDCHRGILIVAEMSSKGNLISGEYSQKCVEMMQEHKSGAKVSTVGLICQSRLCKDPECIQMTPGVNLASTADNLGQTYVTVEEAILKRGADAVIVGRGITGSKDGIESAAIAYKNEGWQAYVKRCNL